MLKAFREILERNHIAILVACLALSIPLSGCGSRPPGTLAVYDSTAGAAKAETFVLGAQAEASRACLIQSRKTCRVVFEREDISGLVQVAALFDARAASSIQLAGTVTAVVTECRQPCRIHARLAVDQ